MAADVAFGSDISSRSFSKRVPATSVSPTYKLTLPSEFVSGALSHLVDSEFKVVDANCEHAYHVAILPRKNKDKYEYTLQGWRAFAEEQSVKTGDVLDFELLQADQLQIKITRRPPLDQLLANFDPEVPTKKITSATSSNEERQLLQFGGRQSLLGPTSMSSGSPFRGQAQTPSPTQPGLLQGSRVLDILELGHDPRDEARHLASPQTEHSRVQHSSDAMAHMSSQQSFRPSSDSETMQFADADAQLWLAEDIMGESFETAGPKRQRVHAQAHGGFGSREPSMDTPVVSLPSRQQMAYQTQPGRFHQSHSAPITGQAAAPHQMYMQRPGEGRSPSDPSSTETEGLRRELSRAMMRERHVEREFTALLRGWRAAAASLDQHTANGLALSRALLGVADRLGEPELLRALDAQASRQLSGLRTDLRRYVEALLDVLWNVRHSYQQQTSANGRGNGQLIRK